MTNEQILALIRAYGDACAAHANASRDYPWTSRGDRELAAAYDFATAAKRDALACVEAALSTVLAGTGNGDAR